MLVSDAACALLRLPLLLHQDGLVAVWRPGQPEVTSSPPHHAKQSSLVMKDKTVHRTKPY
jgi:hypothetical protein